MEIVLVLDTNKTFIVLYIEPNEHAKIQFNVIKIIN